VQGAQLLDDEEQKDDHWPPRVLEVLQSLPQAYRSQRNQITLCRALDGSAQGEPLKAKGFLQGRKLNG
jgi:hypothetical protein